MRNAISNLARLLFISLAFVVVACDSVTLWFAPNTSCADWQHMADEKRSAIVDQIIRDASILEPVRVAQHAPVGTPEEQLVAMAVSSVTKNCEIQSWSPNMRVKDVVRDLYMSAASGAAIVLIGAVRTTRRA